MKIFSKHALRLISRMKFFTANIYAMKILKNEILILTLKIFEIFLFPCKKIFDFFHILTIFKNIIKVNGSNSYLLSVFRVGTGTVSFFSFIHGIFLTSAWIDWRQFFLMLVYTTFLKFI